MATLTSKYASTGAPAKYLHEGTVTVAAVHTWDTTASIGDVLQMVKIPRGAIVTEIVVFADAADHCDIGDGVSIIRYFDSSSALTTRHVLTRVEGVQAGIGYKYAISDAAAVAYDTIDLIFLVADSTVGETTTMIVTYHCDDPT